MKNEPLDTEDIFTDAVDAFTALFYSDRIFIGEHEYPVGQCMVDILNLEESELLRLDQSLLDVYHAIQSVWQEDTLESVERAQKKLQEVWLLVSALPVYRDLNIDWSQPLFQNADLLETFWGGIRYLPSEARAEVEMRLRDIVGITEILRVFRKQISLMLDSYFEPLERRNSEAYAVGVFQFYSDMMTAKVINHDEEPFDHCFPLKVAFVPMMSPTGADKIILAERTEFSGLISFLEVEFYRGLTVGNVPRRCHNCGKYFLLTAGYNTCYCNNIAPGETERTCRKVGAHRKEAQGKANRTPAQVEYDRTYNRLKQRKNRRKISVDEWNSSVARAQDLLRRSECGELSDMQLKKQLETL